MSSLINRVTQSASGNFSGKQTLGAPFDPDKIRGVYLHPDDSDLLSTANNATVALRRAAMQAALVNVNYDSRAFMIYKLDVPTDNGEKVAYETRDQRKKQTDNGTWDKVFTFEGTWAQYQMLLNFHKRTGLLPAFIDANNVLWHVTTPTGIAGFTLYEMTVPMHDDAEPGKTVRYYFRIALSDINEVKTMNHTELGFNPFHPTQGLQGVEPWVLENATPTGASAGIFHVSLKNANAQKLLVNKYAGVLNVAAAWKVTSSTGAAITVSSVALHTSGTEKDAFILTLDTTDTDYTVGDILNISLVDVATLATTYSIKYAETAPLNVTAN